MHRPTAKNIALTILLATQSAIAIGGRGPEALQPKQKQEGLWNPLDGIGGRIRRRMNNAGIHTRRRSHNEPHFGARQLERRQSGGFHNARWHQRYEIEELAKGQPGWRVMRVAALGYETPRDLMRKHQHQRVLDYFKLRYATEGTV